MNSKDGQAYYVFCYQCGWVLLLVGEQACISDHGKACETYVLPVGVSIPSDFNGRVYSLFFWCTYPDRVDRSL